MAIENVRSESAFDDPERFGGTAPFVAGETDAAAKERERRHKLHGRLMDWLQQEREKQSVNRYQMAIDEDFYDGLQYSEEDAQELINRGQAPLVFNLIKPTINWLLGTERRTRVDGKVFPRAKDDEENAETKTKMLKYLNDVNRTQYARSDAWASCVIAGLGWLEDGINTNPEEELLYSRYENWRYVYHDSSATERDLQDARYQFRFRWMDLDVAIALLPEHEEALQRASVDSDAEVVDEDDIYYLGMRVNGEMAGVNGLPMRRSFVSTPGSVLNRRQRVKVWEGWYRDPKQVKMIRGGRYHGETYDPSHAGMADEIAGGYCTVVTHARMQMRCALFTDSDLLFDGESPYRHNRFPLTPMWCYRRRRDGMPYGVIRDIRDAQEDYNKRASKALYILSTVRVVMDHDAVDDVEELRAEVARPDAVVTKKRGTELRIDQDKQLAQEHLLLMDRNAKMIYDTGGVTESNLGRGEDAKSGVAIGKLQDQGSIVTAPLFDNMRYAIQTQSSIQLSLMEQYYSEQRVVRIVGENKPIEWMPINRYDPTTGRFLNDITAFSADYIVAEQDFRASLRQAMFETMMDLISKLPPEISLALLDMVIDFADVPNKDEIIARIRKINGQKDPSVRPTPAEEAAQQKAEQDAQKLKDMQMQQIQAELQKTLAEVQRIAAQAAQTNAASIREGVTAAYEALQGAQIVSTVPNVTPVADAILAGAGYKDQGGQDPNLPAPSGTLPAMTPQDAHGDFVGAATESGPATPQAGEPPVQPGAPEPNQADGAQAGIETLRNDGVQQ